MKQDFELYFLNNSKGVIDMNLSIEAIDILIRICMFTFAIFLMYQIYKHESNKETK